MQLRLPGRTVAKKAKTKAHAPLTTLPPTLSNGVHQLRLGDNNARIRHQHHRAVPERGLETVQIIKQGKGATQRGILSQGEARQEVRLLPVAVVSGSVNKLMAWLVAMVERRLTTSTEGRRIRVEPYIT